MIPMEVAASLAGPVKIGGQTEIPDGGEVANPMRITWRMNGMLNMEVGANPNYSEWKNPCLHLGTLSFHDFFLKHFQKSCLAGKNYIYFTLLFYNIES